MYVTLPLSTYSLVPIDLENMPPKLKYDDNTPEKSTGDNWTLDKYRELLRGCFVFFSEEYRDEITQTPNRDPIAIQNGKLAFRWKPVISKQDTEEAAWVECYLLPRIVQWNVHTFVGWTRVC